MAPLWRCFQVVTLLFVLILASTAAEDDPCADGSCSSTPKQVRIKHDDDNEGISEEKANIRLLSLEKTTTRGIVIAFDDLDRGTRMLTLKRFGLGGYFTERPDETPLHSQAIIEAVKWTRPKSFFKRVALLGMGAGHTTRLFQKLGSKVTVVESEHQIEKMNEKHFNTKPDTIQSLALRTWIEANAEANDFAVVIHDAFANGDRPLDSLTRYAIKTLESSLSDNGIFVLKFPGHLYGKYSKHTGDMYTTLKSVFTNVRVYVDRNKLQLTQKPFANFIFFASKGSVEFEIPGDILSGEVDRTRPTFAWQNMDKWEEQFQDTDKYEIIADKTLKSLMPWVKKMTYDSQQDMFYKIPKRIWNLSQDYLKVTRDVPSLDDDDEEEEDFDLKKMNTGPGDRPEDLLHVLQNQGKMPSPKRPPPKKASK